MNLKRREGIVKIKNLNNSFNNRYKRQYNICGIKITVKNKEKILFYKNQKEKLAEKKYNKRKKQLEELKKYRLNNNYLLTCYVITYNQQEIIEKCLNSLLEQRTQYKYLIKILDDASSDGTFDICLKYAQKYPDKIELNTLCHNSGGKMLTIAYEDINTKYFCRIDGDDYWCDENKIQKSLAFLEKHPDYVTYAHDTALLNLYTNVSKSNIHDYEQNKNIQNEISFDNFFYVHVSSRIHRNVLDFKNKYKNIRKRDRILWYLLLDAGKAYYEDKIMAVYTIGGGFHNKQDIFFKSLSHKLICYKVNKLLKYKYDKCFEKQVNDSRLKKLKCILGIKLGWLLYIFIVKNIEFYTSYINNLIKKAKMQSYNTNRYTGNFIREDLIDIEKARREFI